VAGEIEVLAGNLPQCRFVHHKSHMTWSGLNPGQHGGKPATNRLSYGTALVEILKPAAARVSSSLPSVQQFFHTKYYHSMQPHTAQQQNIQNCNLQIQD
jgi:hypothetical protein